jgi:AcrR family transcriptional regulator
VPAAPSVKQSSRDRILDAAATVMRERGLANTTTRAIATAAEYSEAMLYKHFADKQDLFLAVLTERLPAVRPDLDTVGTGDLEQNLSRLIERFMSFFVQTFPIAASIFGAPELLAQHRAGVRSRGFGPEGPTRILEEFLAAERVAGRVGPMADVASVARLLVGVAFHQAFLAAFDARDEVPGARGIASAAVAAVMPALRGANR